MIAKLCVSFGDRIVADDDDGRTTDYHNFPRLEQLCGDDVETQLKTLGFGYRAAFVARAAKEIQANGGATWLNSLHCRAAGSTYERSLAALTQLHGVGRKVADCVLLMALGFDHVVPIDTHVLQVGSTDPCPTVSYHRSPARTICRSCPRSNRRRPLSTKKSVR